MADLYDWVLQRLGPWGFPLLVVLAGLAGGLSLRRLRRRVMPEPKGRSCAGCGYDLTGIHIPRCPECGRAVGFDCTFEELGISERDVERHVTERRHEKP